MNKKYVFPIISLIFLFSPIFGSNVFASDSKGIIENLTENLTIEILNDGRVAPVEDYNEISEEEIDLILDRIGYESDYFKKWDINRKRKYVSYGGKVLEGNIDSFKHQYISNKEKSYEIDSTNIDKIREIQLQDLEDRGIKNTEIERFNVIDKDKHLYTE